ncbi:MAG: type II and III secretion system protein family protein, partial [Deltaproteobacteria bacterium]
MSMASFRKQTFSAIRAGRRSARGARGFVLTVGLSLAAFGQPATASGREAAAAEKIIEIPVGGSQTVRVPSQLDRVVVGDPTVCDVVPLPPGQLLLTAKIAGETQITVWSREGGVSFYHVSAITPVGVLQQALREAFPGEEDLQAHSAGGAVYLTGTVSDASVVEAAHRLANSLLLGTGKKNGDIINLTSVSTSQQVQLQLRFVDVSRTSLRQIGFNTWYKGTHESSSLFGPNDPRNFNDTTQTFTGPQPNDPNLAPMPVLISPVQGAFALSFASGRFGPISATLSLMEGRGVAKTLSEPTLVANSGEAAHFIVGGEFPIPVPDPLGRVIIQFKPYGTQLTFTPTVVGQDTVHLSLDAVVSDIDRQSSVTVGTASVPGIITRESSTAVRLRDGQSFAIAGLVTDRISSQDQKIPILGDIPLVGALFRNTNYSRSEEELVVLVSVRLVKPMDVGEVPPLLHEDEFSDPNDLQLFLLGMIDQTKPQLSSPVPAGTGGRRSGAPRAMGTPGGVV